MTALVPGPSGEGLLGSLAALRRDPLDFFLGMAREHGGLARFRIAHLHAYLVSEPAYIKRVLVDNLRNYVKGVSYQSLRIVLGDGLLTAEGDLWRKQRRLLNPAFARQLLLEKVPVMVDCVEAVCARWQRQPTFDLVPEMMRLAFDVVGKTLMGAEIAGEMAEVESVLGPTSDWVYRHMQAPVKWPRWFPSPSNLRLRRYLEVLERVVGRVIARHRDGDGPPDLLSMLIGARDDDGAAMSDRQLRDEVLTFLLAGHETTGSALAWTFLLLFQHPEVEERLRAELDRVLGGRAPTAEDLPKLVYLGQVLNESMRLYPPAWSFTRTALAEDELGGHRIPAGAMIIVSPWVNHRLPRFWSSPETFDPARFSAEAVKSHDTYQYFPFGGGPHMCIGKHLTLFELKIAMAMLLGRFRLERTSDDPVPPAPEVSLRPGAPMPVRVTPR